MASGSGPLKLRYRRPRMSPERFSSLLESARQGSEAAWQELYGGLAPAILGYLRANGAPDPEDILLSLIHI